MPTIQLSSGEYWNISQPSLSEPYIDIEVIAHSLSHICRFTGHTKKFYSVAQHAYLCSTVNPNEHAFAKLLHDISEATLGDVSTPLKRLLPEYKRIEVANEAVLFRHFGLPAVKEGDPLLPDCVKEVDIILLITEKRDLLPSGLSCSMEWGWSKNVVPLRRKIRPWSPRKAKHMFLSRFYALCPDRFLSMARWKHVLKHRAIALFGF